MGCVGFALVHCKTSILSAIFSASLIGAALAISPAEPMRIVEQKEQRPAEGIQDNSFLIEEAYNQDEGVVQHILNIVHTANRHAGEKSDALSFVFTQEWPAFSQTHQLSYTIPYTFLDQQGQSSTNGFEDISLNYRFQALTESAKTPAFAPRFTLILPTGDADDDLGNGRVGYQINLPVSKIVSDRWTIHGNAGVTLTPDVMDHDLSSYNLGASVVYAVSSNFNLMLESFAEFEEEVEDNGGTTRPASVVISPGLRYAFNFPDDAQLVVGIAAPIGVTSAAPDFGVFLYASFEHMFAHPRSGKSGK